MSTRPRSLGKYKLQERLGRGGMGEVWKAFDPQLQRYVAIKLLLANLQADPGFVARFKREAQLVASLHHPNIVQIHDFQFASSSEDVAQVSHPTSPYESDADTTTAYMVMNYVEGETLADYIRDTSRKGQFPPAADIVSLFTAISLAIDYAHRQGMIHRDIKPANILLNKQDTAVNSMGEPILTDFGIAKLQGTSTVASTHAGLGTPLYISPEQAHGHQGDGRSDLYSLGIILYEMLTGVTPFRGDNPFSIMMQHFSAIPPPPVSINPSISPAVSAVMLRSIAKDPDARFPSASAMTIALAQALNEPIPTELRQHLQPTTQLTPSTDMTPLPPSPLALSFDSRQTTLASSIYQTPSVPVNPSAVSTPIPASKPTAGRPRRGLIITVITVLLLVLISSGLAAYFILPQKSSTVQSSVVGHMSFISSNQHKSDGTAAIDDQVQLDLQNIPSPPSGKSYYAWLEGNFSEVQSSLHWALPVNQNAVHYLYAGDSQHSNLLTLTTSHRFLITEDDAVVPPQIPNPTFRLYYATIPQTQTPSSTPVTLDVLSCPSSSTSRECF